MNAEIFFQLSPIAQCCVTPDLLIVKWNQAFEQLAGIQVHTSDQFQKFISAEDHSAINQFISSLTAGETKELSFSLQIHSGKTAPISWKIHRDHQVCYFFQLPDSSPASEKPSPVEEDTAFTISADALKSLVNHSADMIARFDTKLRYTFVNDVLVTLSRQDSALPFLGKTTREMAPLLGVPEDNFTRWTHDLQLVVDTGTELMHYDSISLASNTLHFQTRMFPEYTAGTLSGVLVITRINNELKNSEEKLIEQKNLLRLVFDCMQEGVMVMDTDHNFVLTNKQARTALPIELTTKNYQEWASQVEVFYPDKKTVLPPEEIPAFKALRGETVYDQLGYYKHKKAKEGIFFSLNASPLTNASGKVIGSVVVFNNVSERILIQTQMANSLTMIKSVIESTPDMVVAIDKNYTILTVNAPGRESFKLSTGITIDKDSNLLETLAHTPEVAAGVNATWAKALQGKTYSMLHEVENNQTGSTFYESVYSPMYNEKGEVIGATMVARDVTLKLKQENEIRELLNKVLHLNQLFEEKNKALLAGEEELSAANEQLKIQQEELRQTVDELASRNFELDQLVYKMSHDIRSPLTSILGLANVMKADADTSQWPLYLSYIENRVLTLDRFVQSMINYAKANRSIEQAQLVDFQAILEQSKHDLAYMKGFENIEISLEISEAHVAFYGDQFRLQILFNNIVSNAIKYQNPYADTHTLHVCVTLSPTQAELTFTDNGIGIKEDHINRIFDMFYRATEHTDGSGLGLYIVKQTVEKMKGKISLQSEYGHMTRFIIVLPNLKNNQK